LRLVEVERKGDEQSNQRGCRRLGGEDHRDRTFLIPMRRLPASRCADEALKCGSAPMCDLIK
jgi:hypothetical protein